MSVSDSFFRHQCILRKLRKGSASMDEIRDYYQLECEIHGFNFVFSSRTFVRDKNEILSIYKKEISCNHSTKKYFIEEDPMPNELSERMIDAFDTYMALNLQEGLGQFVHLEKQRGNGMEHFGTLLQAIKNKRKCTFTYEKYYDKNITERWVSPLGLKEFDKRWYLVAKDQKDDQIKSFALDRMQHLSILEQKFKAERNFNLNSYFEHCFGIIKPGNIHEQPQSVLLSFTGEKGKFIKSLPLHHSQRIVADLEQKLTISLHLYITYDFIMELLSHGNDVTVESPTSLQNALKEILSKNLQNYL